MKISEPFQIPHSDDAEQAVLGGLLLDNEAFDRLGSLRATHFYRADHQAIFSHITKLLEAGQGADIITLNDRLPPELADLAYLHSLTTNTPSTANIGRHADIVRNYAQRRELMQLASMVQEEAGQIGAIDTIKLLDKAQSGLERIAETRAKCEPVHVSDDLPGYLAELQLRADGGKSKAIPTGYPEVDKKLKGGVFPGDLIIVGGRPKMGKTAFALNVGMNAAVAGYSVGELSMEMPRIQLHDRNTAMVGKIDLDKLLEPQYLTSNDWPGVTHAIKTMESLKLFIDDQGGLTLMDVRMKAKMIKRRQGLDLLIIDYLQLMSGEGANRNTEIETITRGLKTLAKEIGCGIILLSQLNRKVEERPNKRPSAADLRDSGAIEQDCDAAIFLYRDEVYNPDSLDKGICEVIVGLIRRGEPGTVGLTYIGSQTRFESLPTGYVFGRRREAPAKKQKGFY